MRKIRLPRFGIYDVENWACLSRSYIRSLWWDAGAPDDFNALELLQALDGVKLSAARSSLSEHREDATEDARRLYIVLHMVPLEVMRAALPRMGFVTGCRFYRHIVHFPEHSCGPLRALKKIRAVLEEVSV